MGKIDELKDKILYKCFNENEESYLMYYKYYPKLKNFIWTICVFVGGIYVFFKIYDRIGFHKTIIILMIGISVYLRSWLKVVSSKK